MENNKVGKKVTCESVDESIKCALNFDSNLYNKSEKICLAEKYFELRFQNPKLKDSFIAKEIGVSIRYLNKSLRELSLKPERKRYARLKYSYDREIKQFVEDQYGNFYFDVKTKKFEQIPQAKTKITLTSKRNILASKNMSGEVVSDEKVRIQKSRKNVSGAGGKNMKMN